MIEVQTERSIAIEVAKKRIRLGQTNHAPEIRGNNQASEIAGIGEQEEEKMSEDSNKVSKYKRGGEREERHIHTRTHTHIYLEL
ncbi:hypothetical protein F2Q70_00004438 [Brassica cretica]|uniref:Uncharacterized protein n=2 Tax=Brassica cretica TaxID=69181 RepID=A0A8S9FY32_BRACR|nr:hypothetical protein F2Q68_00021300 [Brassica cretica]KAF2572684.1 hypothetical protein F2Q70_00004438 [Brassica cretica]KAF3563744.1 hypothetical protein DY000_02016464 [Brassica cretica]